MPATTAYQPFQTDRQTVEVHQSQQTDRVVDVLIVTQQQVPKFQKVQKTSEFPHVALIVRILDVHVVMQDKFSPAE